MVAVDVEGDAFVVAVDLGFHADELGVEVVAAGLGHGGEGVGGAAVPGGDADVGAGVAGDVFAPGIVGDVDLDRAAEGVDAGFAVAAEGDGADVAGGDAVGFYGVDDGLAELLDGVAEGHAVDVAGVAEALHVLGEAEDGGGVRLLVAAGALGVAADALEDGGAVVDDVGHDVDVGVVPGDEFPVVPDVFGGLQRHRKGSLLE